MWLKVVPACVVGLVFGSFVTALTHRAPRGKSVAHGRSACPVCGHQLNARDLVPVLSWLVQRGRCRYCAARISWRYPAIELTTAALFVAAVIVEPDALQLALLLAVTVAMVALAVIDLEQGRMPNGFIVVLAALALAWRWRLDGAILASLGQAAVVFALGVLFNAAFKMTTARPGLGMGDAKLLAAVALALPVPELLVTLAIAGTLGVAFGLARRLKSPSEEFPFAPAIGAAFWIGLTRADALLGWLTCAF